MTWLGPSLDSDQRTLQATLDTLAASRDVVLGDDPEVVSQLAVELASMGLWTLGTAEAAGGGGADDLTATVVLERLGRWWPALGWAAAQAHAAVDAMESHARCYDLVQQIHTAQTAVAVVDASSAQVHLAWRDGRLCGSVDRVDAAAETPALILLDREQALVVPASATAATPLRRTGLGGAFTRRLDVDASADEVIEIVGSHIDQARTRLWSGGAAVAAGIAGVASDDAASYAAARSQFGGTLTELPTVRQSLVEQVARTSAVLSAASVSGGASLNAYAALREACDAAIYVAAAALQVHGGYGYLTEYAAERRLRDAVSLRAAVGVHSATVGTGRDLVGLPTIATLQRDAG